jgi:hypothetical protein
MAGITKVIAGVQDFPFRSLDLTPLAGCFRLNDVKSNLEAPKPLFL